MPQPGDIAVTPTASGKWYDRVIAAGIRWGTARKVPAKRSWRTLWRNYRWEKSPVNHTFGYEGNGIIIEAARRVQRNTIHAHPQATWVTLPAHLTPNATQRAEIVKFWESKLGNAYNWLDIIAVGVAQERFGNHLKTLSRKWWVKRLSSWDSFICSELMDAGYQSAGIELFTNDRPRGLVSPEDLRELDVNAH